jgi:hypothetical protein
MTPREALDWIVIGSYRQETCEEHDRRTDEAVRVLSTLVADAS